MRRAANAYQSGFRYLFTALALPCIAAAWWACAASNDDTTPLTSSTGVSSSSGHGGDGGSGGIINVGGSGGIEECTATSVEAKAIPIDMLFLVDQSRSMSDYYPGNNGGKPWTATTEALDTFFNDPASAGIGAGLAFTPITTGCPPANPGCPGSDCEFFTYAVPVVPIAPLPGNAFTLTNALPADATGCCTPNYPALHGTLLAATAYQDAHPTHKVNLVFATDGEPWTGFSCSPVTIDMVAGLAKDALDYNGVHTYVIGLDATSNIDNLNKLAVAGGTTAAYDVETEASAFSAAIAAIRSEALGCEFEIPPPPAGMELVPDSVNFTYTPGGADMPLTLPRADDLADCGDEPGWYYDDNLGPTKIILCPASCGTVQNDPRAKVATAFGCKSVLN